MKERNTIHAFLLHYGISTVLLCMLVAIVVMLNTVDINQKVTADLLKEKGEYKAYVVKNTYLSLDKGGSLTIDAMEGGEADVYHTVCHGRTGLLCGLHDT